MGTILLFYKFIHIADPESIMAWQKNLCQTLELKGRIIIAHQGINGTLGGSTQATQEYIKAMNTHPLFDHIDFKESSGSKNHFPRLQIKIKKEIVHLGIDPATLNVADGAIHITPSQAHELLSKPPKDLVILDCRNSYETAVGTISGSIKPPTSYFREFPSYIDAHIDQFKDKEVLMYCTGGVRCEPASAYLKSKGITKQIYQISGGIHRYTEEFPDGYFRGKNYVFDDRIAARITPEILSTCYLCTQPCDEYSNCLRAACNYHYLCCKNCFERYQNTCSRLCQKLVYTHHAPKRPARTALYPKNYESQEQSPTF